MQVAGIDSRQGGAAVAAGSGAGERISRAGRLIHNRPHLMVIPAVGVVIDDHDRSVIPIRRLLQEVDHVHDKRLLVERIGISGVPVLISLRFQEADRWEVTVLHRRKEVIDVVLVIGRTVMSDLRL